MITADICFWVALAGLFISAFAAMGAKVVSDFSRHELEEYCRRKRRLERFDEILHHDEHIVPCAESLEAVGTVLMVIAATCWLMRHGFLTPAFAWPQLSLAALAISVLLMVTNVWLPWTVLRLWAAPFLYHTWTIWRVIGVLLGPLAIGVRGMHALASRLAGRTDEPSDEEAFEDEIRAIVAEGMKEGHLEEDAGEMIEGVIELSDADVADIMTPRSQMASLNIELGWKESIDYVMEVGHTRLPVYRDSLDTIVGILFVKDLLPMLSGDARPVGKHWSEMLRRPWFVPKTKRLDDLLQEFLHNRQHMAIVVDEYSAVAGLVTIEDVLEEIVGEITDESDKEVEADIRQIDPGTFEANARAHLEELNELQGLDLPDDEEYDTIGGFVISRLGRIPRIGEFFRHNGLRIIVVAADSRRVERVRIEVEGPAP